MLLIDVISNFSHIALKGYGHLQNINKGLFIVLYIF